jgi:gluconolactonase
MILCSGLSEPEAPVALPDGSWLVVEMGPDRGCVSHVSADGEVRPLARTGRPNGLAVDGRGDIWVAESQAASLLVLTPEGEVRTRVTGAGGMPFRFPNDLAFGPDGALYLTDSGIPTSEFFVDGAIRPDWAAAPYDGRLFRVDPATLTTETLDAGIRFANGLAFDAHGDLYVDETMTGLVFRYRLSQGSTRRENVASVLDPRVPTCYRGPDGMAVDVEGRLYVAVFGQGDVTVLDPDGRSPPASPRPAPARPTSPSPTAGNHAWRSPRSSAASSRCTTSPPGAWRCTRPDPGGVGVHPAVAHCPRSTSVGPSGPGRMSTSKMPVGT